MTHEPDMVGLAAFAAGDMDAGRAGEIEAHVGSCENCRKKLAALADVDASVTALVEAEPPASVVLRVRRRLSEELRGRDEPEIMTLKEVAEYLRISLDDLGEVLDEIPAFELAGQIRIRRAKLVEWVERREQEFLRSRIASEVAALVGTARRRLSPTQRR